MIKTKGFTLIELLVVIAIIGILASVVLASISSASAKARDTQRKSDLHQISLALELYKNTYGTYVVAGTGFGSSASGSTTGWFSYTGTNYPKAVAQGLYELGMTTSPVVDPSKVQIGNIGGRSGYMIKTDINHYTLWANLEDPSAADKATISSGNCYFHDWDAYHSSFPASAQQNYCISNQ